MIAPFSAELFGKLNSPLKFHLGNNDGEILILRQRLLDIGAEFHKYDFEFELENKKFLVQHGPVNLEAIAASGRYDVIIYGHTHDLDVRKLESGGRLIITRISHTIHTSGGTVPVHSGHVAAGERNSQNPPVTRDGMLPTLCCVRPEPLNVAQGLRSQGHGQPLLQYQRVLILIASGSADQRPA